MRGPYFGSAEEAAFQLRLPLVLAAPSAVAVPHLASRLSEFAPQTVMGARIFHRLHLPATHEPPAVWVVAPEETLEHLGWAVGLAEHAARSGQTALLLDLDRSQPLRSVVGAGSGQPLPAPIRARLARLGLAEAASWTSDLQGVRIVLPVARLPETPEMELSPNWILIVARTLPETIQEIGLIARNVDGILLAAGFRDHSRQELEEITRALYNAGGAILGMIAIGPSAAVEAPLAPDERAARPITDAAGFSSGMPPVARPEAPPPEAPAWPAPAPRRPLGPPPPPPPPPPAPAPPAPAPPPPVAPAPPPPPPPQPPPPIPVFTPSLAPSREPAVAAAAPAPPRKASVALATEWDRQTRRRRWRRGLLGSLLTIAVIAFGGWVVLRLGILPMPPQSRDADSEQGATEPQREEAIDRPATGTGGGPASSAPDGFAQDLDEETGGPAAPADTTPVYRPPADSPLLRPGPSAPTQSAEDPRLFPGRERRVEEPRLVPDDTPREEEARLVPEEARREEAAGGPSAGTGSPAETTPSSPQVRSPREEAPAAETDAYVVHVSSFRREGDAQAEISRLQANGIHATIVPVVLEGRGRWLRVVVGSYTDSVAAQLEANRLRGAGLVSFSQVLSHGGRGDVRAPAPR